MMKRQGDILIIRINSMPQDAIKQANRILAEGEATGHMHELDQGEVYEKNGTLYFKVEENSEIILKHPEHKPVTFETGVYKVVRQREYEPQGWKYVAD